MVKVEFYLKLQQRLTGTDYICTPERGLIYLSGINSTSGSQSYLISDLKLNLSVKERIFECSY